MLSISGILFIATGLQYWTSNYLTVVLDIDKIVASEYVAILSISAPVTGLVTGGVITNYYGGYNSYNAQLLTIIMGWFCTIVTIPIPWVTNFAIFGTLVWLLMFFGAAIMAPLTGMMLNAVDNSLRGSANSISQFTYNMFGYLPAPIVYGFISYVVDKDNVKKQSHLPLMVIVYSVFITSILVTFALRRKLLNILDNE